MRPSREQALSEYFKHESEKIRLNRPDVTNATYTCVCFFADAVNTEDVVAAFDDGGTRIDIPVWHEEQKATVDNWQTVEGLKNAIMSRIDDCGLEEYEGLWSIGEVGQFEYSSDEAFLAEVDWEYLLGITKNCWALVSVNTTAPTKGTVQSLGIWIGDLSKMLKHDEFIELCESFPASFGPPASGLYEWKGHSYIVWRTMTDGTYSLYDTDSDTPELAIDQLSTDVGMIACIPEDMSSEDEEVVAEDCAYFELGGPDEDCEPEECQEGWDVEVNTSSLTVEWYTIK